MRFAPFCWDHLAVDDRRLTGDALPRAISVPMERAPIRMPAVGLALLVEVREAIELRETVGVVLAHHVHLHGTEPPRKRHLPLRRNILRTEQEHLMPQERLI